MLPLYRRPLPIVPALALALGLAAGASQAQYKVVGPDGRVTYTDRAPSTTDGKVTALGTRTAPGDAALPLELRQAAARYPVVLYTAISNCEPCDSARQLLRQRGIPYIEKQVLTPEDGEALERLSGGRDAPVLAIGTQLLRGLAPEVWASYLDAAGYPRDSRLPASYQYAAPAPLTERREAARATPRQAASTADAPAPAVPVANPSGIKF
jgi:glutaredoxin